MSELGDLRGRRWHEEIFRDFSDLLCFEHGKRGKVGKSEEEEGEEGGDEWGLVWWLGGGERKRWRGFI